MRSLYYGSKSSSLHKLLVAQSAHMGAEHALKFSGKDPGSAHQMPSVSSSSGIPSCSTSALARCAALYRLVVGYSTLKAYMAKTGSLLTGSDKQTLCFESRSEVYLYHSDEHRLYVLCSLC